MNTAVVRMDVAIGRSVSPKVVVLPILNPGTPKTG
jgi:hypothetical protein